MVACSTPVNGKGLLKSAIRSQNPVLFFEHVLLYNIKQPIPTGENLSSLEKAEVVREGKDVTLLTYSRMRHYVIQAARILVSQGYDPEVIDLVSLKPLDMGTIARSIRKTHRAIIVEECMRTGGIGATLRASIMEYLFDELDGPVVCLSSQDVPTPYSGLLEDMTVVQPGQIVQAVKSMCSTDSF